MTLIIDSGYTPLDDPDAQVYIAAVEAADQAASPGIGALEDETKAAIHAFIKGCKNDGIWPAIKASCILAGARTLTGALVPLVGAAPTSVGFVNADYNRETGLVGNASTKYLNANRADNADPQDSSHLSVYISTADSRQATLTGMIYIGSTNAGSTSRRVIGPYGAELYFSNRSNSDKNGLGPTVGFVGTSRNTSSGYSVRRESGNFSRSVASVSPGSQGTAVFAENLNGVISNAVNARLAFYSIGESLDLALLDTRVTALINAFGAAIP